MDKKIVFLYLHGIHQLYHSAMIAMELSRIQAEYKVQLLSCHSKHTETLNHIKSFYPDSNCEIITLPQPFRFKYLNFKKKSYPSPHSTMKFTKKYIKDADAILATSHITPKACRKIKVIKPKFIYQYHGCGDRQYGFDPKFKDFDFMLLPGKYHQKRLLEENVINKEKTHIVGWPKLDYPVETEKVKKELFKDNKPIVLYTPHWKPTLGSYKIWAQDILECFSNSKEYNLIFAPHIQIKHWRFKYKYNINYSNYKSENIHIDFGSIFSVDNTYLNIADVYMGDVSSLVYEWIALKPRPCIFLNAHNVHWENNVNYRFWDFGPVVEEICELYEKIKLALNSKSYIKIQSERIKEYMDITTEPSSLRAAKAIYNYLKYVQ